MNGIINMKETFYFNIMVYGSITLKELAELKSIYSPYLNTNTMSETEANLAQFGLNDMLHSQYKLYGSSVFKKYIENKKIENNYIANYYQIASRTVKKRVMMDMVQLIWGNLFNYYIKVQNKAGNVIKTGQEIADNTLVNYFNYKFLIYF
jgi:hypothetical protein